MKFPKSLVIIQSVVYSKQGLHKNNRLQKQSVNIFSYMEYDHKDIKNTEVNI